MRVLWATAPSNEAIVDHGLTARDWVVAAAIVVVGVVLARVLRGVVSKAARGDEGHGAAAEAVGRFAGLILAAIAFVYALGVVGVRLGPLVGALGIGGLALAFAAQNILSNFLASIILQLRRPFGRGDQVSIADCEGTVDEINFRTPPIEPVTPSVKCRIWCHQFGRARATILAVTHDLGIAGQTDVTFRLSSPARGERHFTRTAPPGRMTPL